MKPKIAVFCSGNGSNFEAIAQAVRRGRLKAEIVLLHSDRPEAFAVRRAARHGIPSVVFQPRLFSSRAEYESLLVSILKNQNIDLVVLAGYMRLLTPYFIRAFRGRIVNVHPSLLPAFKGAHAIRDAFAAGVRETGVTIHVVTDKLDAGPILAQTKVRRLPQDKLSALEKRIHRAEHALYPLVVRRYLDSLGKRGKKGS